MAEIYLDTNQKVVLESFNEQIILKEEGTYDYLIDVLLVGGGGGAGGATGGVSVGGGGGGGFLELTGLTLAPGTYSISIGAGGTGFTNGGNTIFSGITAYGGGSGQSTTGSNGASGGGGTTTGGTAIYGSQGYNGGYAAVISYYLGGGGGAGEAGKNGDGTRGGAGGSGRTSTITGELVCYGGGGGAGVFCNTEGIHYGPGGVGGGGDGEQAYCTPYHLPTSGVDGLGGGSGGRGYAGTQVVRGGSGVCIIRYRRRSFRTSSGGMKTTYGDGEYIVHKFLNNGTFTVT